MLAKSLTMSTVSGVASLTVTGTCGLWAMNVTLSAVQFCAAALSCAYVPLAEEKDISVLSLFRNILLNTQCILWP